MWLRQKPCLGVGRGESRPHCYSVVKAKRSQPRPGQMPPGGGSQAELAGSGGCGGELSIAPDGPCLWGCHVGLRIPYLQGASLQKLEASKVNLGLCCSARVSLPAL